MKRNFDKYTQAFAEAWNTLDISPIQGLLAKQFHYSSFWVFSEITSAEEYLDYLNGKFASIQKTGSVVKAGYIHGKRYITLVQDGNTPKCGIILKINSRGKVSRADMMPIEMCC